MRNIIIFLYLTYILSSKEKYRLCGFDLCSIEGGICKRENECFCYPGYITISKKIIVDDNEDEIIDKSRCNYKQISSLKAGFIEMIFGCGLGHFYADRTLNGTIKFLFVSLICSFCLISGYMIKKIREETNAEDHPYVTVLFLLSIFLTFAMILWQLIDGILFFLGVYKDGNGIELY
jgi:hypothetical protein